MKRTARKYTPKKSGPAPVNPAAAKTFETLTTFPAGEPTVRIIFHGLMCFCFDGKKQCQVGLHNTTHKNPASKHPHELKVSVWAKSADGSCVLPIPSTWPVNASIDTGDITIDVEHFIPLQPGARDDILVFQEAASPPADVRNWGHVIDFEELYGPLPTKHVGKLKPSVRIKNHGLFYTIHRTAAQFALHPTDNSGDVTAGQDGHVAEFVAANLYLDPQQGRVVLKAQHLHKPHSPIELRADTGLKYQIDITNNCRRSPGRCAFDAASADPQERNDFFLYYETFDRPGATPKPVFDLILKTDNAEDKDWFKTLKVCMEEEEAAPPSDDKAPCGATGFGGTNNLP
jgi:hypothetical protein